MARRVKRKRSTHDLDEGRKHDRMAVFVPTETDGAAFFEKIDRCMMMSKLDPDKVPDFEEIDRCMMKSKLDPDEVPNFEEIDRCMMKSKLDPDEVPDFEEIDRCMMMSKLDPDEAPDFEEIDRSMMMPGELVTSDTKLSSDSDDELSINDSLTLSHDKIHNKEKEENRGSQYGLDLWKHIFSVGTTTLNVLSPEHNWNFSNLQDAFEEGGVLHVPNNVYLFSSVEGPTCCLYQGRRGDLMTIPVVVAVVSPFPPTHKIGMYSIMSGHKVVEMKSLGMHWDPYIPVKNRSHLNTGSSSSKREPQIFVLSCADRIATLECVKRFDRSLLLEDCLPYFDNPLKKQTCIDIRYPSATEPVGLQLSREEVAASKKMRFYKFYPTDPTSETPVAPEWIMSRTINGYYGRALGIFF